jgi:hypothetical protein
MEIAHAIWQAVCDTYAALAADIPFTMAVVEALRLLFIHIMK